MNGEQIADYWVGYANELCLITGWDMDTVTKSDSVHILFKCDNYAMGTTLPYEIPMEQGCDVLDEVVMDFTNELRERGIDYD